MEAEQSGVGAALTFAGIERDEVGLLRRFIAHAPQQQPSMRNQGPEVGNQPSARAFEEIYFSLADYSFRASRRGALRLR